MNKNNPDPNKPVRLLSEQLILELSRSLEQRNLVSATVLAELNGRRLLTGEPLERMLVREGLVPERDLLPLLSELSGIPFRHIAGVSISTDAVKKVPARIALRYNIMPLDLTAHSITLATCRIPELSMTEALRMLLNMPMEWILCSAADISKTVKHFYGLGADTIDTLVPQAQTDDIELQGKDISSDSAEAGVVKFVNQIIAEAIRMDATDIHIEPFETSLRLRYRIDGLLQEIPVPRGTAQLSKSISSCVKIMADMNIAERRKPHDGRIKVRSGTDEFDLRVSILPTPHGETVNMRILNRKTMFISMDELGLTQRQLPAIEQLAALPHGVVLLTGPTGSGKTTTLYAILSRINSSDVKIITVEDPIEYQLPGISQIQAHAQIGLTFANILRSILRHDPDIVLIGEIRDTETADIAVRASLTGHLVFSTLHTNDAPSAITRLADMGIESYLISSCLEGVIAQRLVRRVCAGCQQSMTPDPVILEEIQEFFPEEIKQATFRHGTGCPDCNFTGYRGRIALFEIMLMNDAIRNMVVRNRPSNEIKQQAVTDGLVTLRKDGWQRAMTGMTTVEEVLRVARKNDPLTHSANTGKTKS